MTVEPLLTIEGLDVGYGGLPVLRGVDLTVSAGEVVAVLGPNGAGKSTLLLAIAGVLWPDAGSLRVLGMEGRCSVHARARHGLGFVPPERGLFSALTVRDNLRIRTRDRGAIDRAVTYFPKLSPLLDRRAGVLSGGELQMLGLAAALTAKPKLLLIDEMSMGLSPAIVRLLLPVIRAVADEQGVGVLLVEQHAQSAIEVSDRFVVLTRGRIVLESESSAFRDDPGQLAALYFAEGPVVTHHN
jgi:branched-chain amino acid transport system ATP-binding protein